MFIQRVSEFFYTKRPYICDFDMERGWRRLEKFVTCLWILLFSKNRPNTDEGDERESRSFCVDIINL